MELDHFFNRKYLSDAEIHSSITKMVDDRNRLFNLLAAAGVGSDPALISENARQFSELESHVLPAVPKRQAIFKATPAGARNNRLRFSRFPLANTKR